MPVGRPPMEFDPERGDAICELIANHTTGLKKLREQYPEVMPNPLTLYKWLDANDEFAEQYARACQAQQDLCVDASLNELEELNVRSFAGSLANAEVSRLRELANHRRWRAERLARTRYGLRQAVELTGAEGKPIEVNHGDAFTQPDTLGQVIAGLEDLGALTDPRAESETRSNGHAKTH